MQLETKNLCDQAVLTLLETWFSPAEAAQWSEAWVTISAKHRSVYDAIVTFVNVMAPHGESFASEAAWFRVLLIDAVTQSERARPALA